MFLFNRSSDLPVTRFVDKVRAHEGAHQVFVGIPHNPGNAFQACNFFRRPLGIAARHQDAALRIPPMNSPHKLANFRVRRSSDRTRVQNRHGAVVDARNFLKPSLKQLLLQRSAVCLAGPAAEVEDVKRSHN